MMVASPNTAPKNPVAAAFARRNEIADHRNGDDDEPAAADPLQAAEHDQLEHVLRQPAQRGAHQEDHDRHLQHDLAAMQIAEFSVERPSHGAGER